MDVEYEYVKCLECDRFFKAVTWAHLKKHCLTPKTYSIKYHIKKFYSEKSKKAISEAHDTNWERKRGIHRKEIGTLIMLLKKQGLMQHEIAEQLAVSQSDIVRWSKQNNIDWEFPDMSGKNNPRYGKHCSEETIAKIRNSMPDMSGKNNPMYGKKRYIEG